MNSTRTRGEKSNRHADPADPPRRRANKQRGHGTFANDRPPIFRVVSRDTGAIRYVVADRATKETCRAIVATYVPADGTIFYTDEWSGYHDVHPVHRTVCHRDHEWARDDDGDGRREVHCNTCEGWGAALRTFLRAFRGVHKAYLASYVALFEALANAKRITTDLVRRMCYGTALCTQIRHEPKSHWCSNDSNRSSVALQRFRKYVINDGTAKK